MSTATATLNVIDGTIIIDPASSEDTDIAHVDGELRALRGETDPWAEDEESLERADVLLAGMGWTRTGEWTGSEEWTAPVRPAA